MHQLFERLSQYGGEAALCVLFLISILSVAVISERIWHFARNRVSADEFSRRLIELLRAGDMPSALALSQRSEISVRSITLAALMQTAHGQCAAGHALDAAALHERVRLQNRVGTLSNLARLSLLIGLAGTLFDVLALNASNGLAESLTHASNSLPIYRLVAATLAPTVAGLVVGIMTWLATGMLSSHVQRQLFECDMLARLISFQLGSEATVPIYGAKPNQAA